MRRARIKAIPSAVIRKRPLNKPPDSAPKEGPVAPPETKIEAPDLDPKKEEISTDNIIVKSLDEPTIKTISIDNVIVKQIHESSDVDDVGGPVDTPVIEFILPEPEEIIKEKFKSPLRQSSSSSGPPETNEIIEALKSPSKESREFPKSPSVITSPRSTIGLPSPTKLISKTRLSFIRPSPRLDGNSRIRRNSVQGSGASASESEDDSRRQNRIIQNEKSSNNTGGMIDREQLLNDNDNSDSTGTKNKKSDSAKRLMESRREFNRLYGTKNPPDKSKMKMYDLIYYNPRNNPMKKNEKSVNQKEAINNTTQADDAEDEDDEDADNPDSSSSTAVPQLEFDVDGKLIVDKQSLLINTDVEKKRKKLSRRIDNDNCDMKLGGFYKRKKKSKDWLKYDTIKFYKALSTIGTDFSLMQTLFPDRPRQNIKTKFKKEEKIHPDLIHKALSSRHNYDIEKLKKEFDEIDKTLEKELEMSKSKELNKKNNEPGGKRGKKRKYKSMARSAIPEVDDDDDDNENVDSDCVVNDKDEETENSKKSKKPPKNQIKYKFNYSKQKKTILINKSDEDDDDDVEEVGELVQKKKPTRSGRIAKLRTVKTQCRTILDEIYTEVHENNAQKKSEINKKTEENSATSPNIKNNEPGEKILKLFMISSDTEFEADDVPSSPSMNKNNNETLSDAVSDQ